jgi:hypothetical protein
MKPSFPPAVISERNLTPEQTMKITILAVAVAMTLAGTAFAQTSSPKSTTAPSGETPGMNGPNTPSGGLDASSMNRRPTQPYPSNGATGAVSPDAPNGSSPAPTAPSTDPGVGSKNGSGKAGGGSR